ncbi:MAG: FecR domain-containing protein [Oscillospiraceae bacterium]|nr:FecR domain-containing protein [Oscillospiraceae bacterium]
MKKLKAISIFVLCFALLFSSTITASAAQSAKAATLRLEKTQGTVTVTNASGTSKKATQNMKLLSGYTVSTGKASYAYISLDSSKALKLDASSKVSIHKAGKKLEVKVVSGKVMFNVSAPLTSQESLTIRTSTMVTGVRGTAGWFESDQTSSAVYLLEGSLDVYSTGRSKPINITSGQQMTSQTAAAPGTSDTPTTPDGSGSPGETEVPADVKVESFSTEEVPGFVAAAVAEDTSLQSRMQDKGSPIDAAAVASVAEEKLKQDETAAAKQEQQIQQQEKESTAEAQKNQENSNNTLFEDNKPAAPSAPVAPPKPTPRPEPKPEPEPEPEPNPEPEPTFSFIELENPTQEALQDALYYYDIVNVSFKNSMAVMPTSDETDDPSYYSYHNSFAGLIIPESKTLNLMSGTMILAPSEDLEGAPVTVSGTLYVQNGAVLKSLQTDFGMVEIQIEPSGTIQVDGEIYNAHSLINNGNLTIAPKGTLYNYGNLCNDFDGELINLGILNNQADMEGGDARCIITNYGEFLNATATDGDGKSYHSTLNLSSGEFRNTESGTFTNAYECTVTVGSNDEKNSAELIFAVPESEENHLPAINHGTINIYRNSAMRIESDCIFSNTHVLNNSGTIENYGQFENSYSRVRDNGKEEVTLSGNLTNNGAFDNYGTLQNNPSPPESVYEPPVITNYGTLKNYENTGRINICSGTLSIESGSTFENQSEAFAEMEMPPSIRVGEGEGNSAELILKNDFTNGRMIEINQMGKLTISADAKLTNACIKITEDGDFERLVETIRNFGTIENVGTLENYGAMVNYGGFNNNGTFGNYGKFFNDVCERDGASFTGYIENHGTITNTTDGDEPGIFENYGTLENKDLDGKPGSIVNHGTFYNQKELTNEGTIENYQRFENRATLINVNNGSILNEGEFFNLIVDGDHPAKNPIIKNSGIITITESGDLENHGTIENNYDGKPGEIANNGMFRNHLEIHNGGTITNNSDFENRAIITNATDGTITNKGTFKNSVYDESNNLLGSIGNIENYGTINNSGTFENKGTIKNSGKIEGEISGDGTITPDPAT